MKRNILIALSFLFGFACLTAAYANEEMDEGYAIPTFKELSQTVLLEGGMDVNDIKVADAYAELVYCGLYSKNFKNDVEWHQIRSRIISRVLEKKESFRILYEISGPFKLDRYNFEDQNFPLTADTAMNNVGTLILFSVKEFTPYCGRRGPSNVFSPNINLVLNRPLNLNKFKWPADDVQKLLAWMDDAKNTQRQVYGRIRFRVIDSPGQYMASETLLHMELRGEITAIDFYLDSELTRHLGSDPLK